MVGGAGRCSPALNSGAHHYGLKSSLEPTPQPQKTYSHIWSNLPIICKIMVKIQNFCYFLPGTQTSVATTHVVMIQPYKPMGKYGDEWALYAHLRPILAISKLNLLVSMFNFIASNL